MVYLDAEELRALREEARAQRISLAELVRRLVKQHLQKEHPNEPSAQAYLQIIGLGSSGRDDISERHDEYLGETLRRQHAG